MNKFQKIIKAGAICLGAFIIINILGTIIWLLSLFVNIDLGNNGKLSFVDSYDNIKNISIEIVSSDIKIIPGDSFRVEASNVSEKISSKVKNDTLKITEKNNWFWNNNTGGEIIIYIPKEEKLKKIEIESGAGKIDIDNISAYNLELEVGAGKLNITHSIFDNTDIDTGAGEVNIEFSNLNNLDMDTGVGKVEVVSSITGNSKIDCGVGELDITLLGTSNDYRIDAEKGIGKITINGEEQKNNTVYGTGQNRLELSGGVGNIKISFKDLVS